MVNQNNWYDSRSIGRIRTILKVILWFIWIFLLCLNWEWIIKIVNNIFK